MSAGFLLLEPYLKRGALLRFRLDGFFLASAGLHGELGKSGCFFQADRRSLASVSARGGSHGRVSGPRMGLSFRYAVLAFSLGTMHEGVFLSNPDFVFSRDSQAQPCNRISGVGRRPVFLPVDLRDVRRHVVFLL